MKKRIQLQDLNEHTAAKLTETDLSRITGGAWYAKFDGVDGSSQQLRKPSEILPYNTLTPQR